MDKQLTFIDFFAGIGGFRLGLEKAGMKCIGYCEKDKFAVKSYRAMYDTGGEWYGEDITKLQSEEIPYADIWTGGFPCTDISVAGKQCGISGERSGLYYEFIKLIKGKKEEDKPRMLIIENVKNLYSIHGGWDFARVLIELDEAGYDAQWQLFNSKNYGVPQNRERVYIVGYLRGKCAGEVFPVIPESCGNLKQIIGGVQGYRVYDSEGVSVTLCSNGGGFAKTGLYLVDQSLTKPKITENARCITARYTAGATKRTAMNSAVMEVIAYPILTPDRVNKRQNGRRIKNADEPMFTITASDKHGVMLEETPSIQVRSAVKCGYETAQPGDSVDLAYPNSKTRRARVGKEIAHNLSCTGQMGVVVWNDKLVRIRRLTPRECFRLQGYPDEYFERVKNINSDAQLYKQAGNGVTVNVILAIGNKIVEMNNSGILWHDDFNTKQTNTLV